MKRMDLFTILKDLQKIEPDQGYSRQSRAFILASKAGGVRPKEGLFGIFDLISNFQALRLTLATEIVGVLIIAVLLGAYYVHVQNRNNLVVQANELNSSIQLKLEEIQYLLQTQPANLSKMGILIESLNKASEKLKTSEIDLKNNDIEGTLQKIKEAQQIFNEIEIIIRDSGQPNPISNR